MQPLSFNSFARAIGQSRTLRGTFNMKRLGRGGLAAFAGLIAWASVGAQSPATSAAADLDATVRAEVVDALAKRLASSYAVAEAGEKMAEAVRSKLAAGVYDRLLAPEEFARALHTDVRAVVDDRHLRVTFDGARPGARPDRPAAVTPDARNGAAAGPTPWRTT
jgi:hypothetical protein